MLVVLIESTTAFQLSGIEVMSCRAKSASPNFVPTLYVLYSGQLSTVIKYSGNTATFHQHCDIAWLREEIAGRVNSREQEAYASVSGERSGGWDDYPLGSW